MFLRLNKELQLIINLIIKFFNSHNLITNNLNNLCSHNIKLNRFAWNWWPIVYQLECWGWPTAVLLLTIQMYAILVIPSDVSAIWNVRVLAYPRYVVLQVVIHLISLPPPHQLKHIAQQMQLGRLIFQLPQSSLSATTISINTTICYSRNMLQTNDR